MNHDKFLTKVAQRADVSRETAQALIVATLITLAERITGGEARDLAAQLPVEQQTFLTGAKEPAEPFDAEEFVRRVARRAGLDPGRARTGTRAVFDTLREAVTAGEFDDVVAQLPKDIRELLA